MTSEQHEAGRWWRFVAGIVVIVAITAFWTWAGVELFAHARDCGGTPMHGGDRCVSVGRQPERFVPAAAASPHGYVVGDSVNDHARGNRITGTVLLLVAAMFASGLVWIAHRACQRATATRRAPWPWGQ